MFKAWNIRKGLIPIFTVVFASNYAYSSETASQLHQTKQNGKILVVMTNHATYPTRTDKTGLWFTELTHFYDVAEAAGYDMDFVSPQGGGVPLDERSLKSIYLDRSAKAHLADPQFMQRLKTTFAPNTIEPKNYKAIYYTGGHGTMWDFPNNKELKN
jgi:hypothetical protein